MQTHINRTEKNNDHTRIMRKIQFRSSFNYFLEYVLLFLGDNVNEECE